MIGDKIRFLRASNHYTQDDLAQKLKISKSTVGMYEQNRRSPDLTILLKLSHIFQVSTDYLLDNTTFISSNNQKQPLNWNMVLEEYPNALCVSPEEEDLISYYQKLSLEDKRWIMGQMIDLLRKSEAKTKSPKAQ